METQEIICRLCLKICDNNFEVIEGDMKDVLDIVLPKIGLAAIQKPVMCINCTVMLRKCYNFKSECFYLKDVFLRKNENDTGEPEDQEVCGFCRNPAKNCSTISPDVEEAGLTLKKMIEQCLPELDLSVIKEPIICTSCRGTLELCYHFVTNCLIVAEKVKKHCETLDVESEGQIELSRLLPFIIKDLTSSQGSLVDRIKVEKQFCEDTKNPSEREICKGDDGIKSEQMFFDDSEGANEDFENKSECFMEFDDQEVNNEIKFTPSNMCACEEDSDKLGSIKGEEILCEEIETRHNEENLVEMDNRKFLVKEEIEIKTDVHDFNRFVDGIVLPQSEVSTRLQGREKDAVPNLEGNLAVLHVKHALINKSDVHLPLEINMKNCDLSSFQAKKKCYLKRHSLVNNNSSEVLIYKCDSCSFQTKHEISLKDHFLKHKDPSEIAMYKCDSCSFQTKYKKCLKKHSLKHKDPSEINMYKCDSCPFQTKHKSSLKDHSLNHKDPSEITMYKCDSCSFQTKQKNHLKTHSLKHKDPSQITMYKCDSCYYQTKYKHDLITHMLRHKDPSKVAVYKCDYCSFQTKFVKDVKQHLLVHKDPSEVTMYKCVSCSFQTKHKNSLKVHSLNHKDPSEVTMYKCDSCSFQTKRKQDLERHLLIHKNPSEVRVYKCNSCSFQTRFKNHIKQHLLVHKDPSEVTMYKCVSCSFQTKHKNSLKIHSLNHKDPSEVTMYKCDSCSFQSKRKYNLKKHLLSHKDSLKVTMHKRTSCSF